MTVRELAEELSNVPPDYFVVLDERQEPYGMWKVELDHTLKHVVLK